MASAGSDAPSGAPIVAFCHLSWDWVWQRPQQFLSRLALRHPLLFVETHCCDVPAGEVQVRSAEAHPNVTILRVHLPASRWSDGAFIDAERRRVVLAALQGRLHGRFERPILWFNDPMAFPAYIGRLGERAVVYDCMDELTQFKDPPPGLLERERALLARADVVFCGGRKMRERRLPVNPNTHFFGTGVDVEHFGAARSVGLPIDPDLAGLVGPVLGYFGVIDERLDYTLIARLADARRDWHVVMVGPTAKIDPADLPRRPNLHWLGARPYQRLPALTKGFSVCLMPFALNAATEYINPTKALEYMAAGRPVVSTALDEVRTNFGEVARVAHAHDEFITLCRREVLAPSIERVERGLALARAHTWEHLTAGMRTLMLEAAGARAAPERPAAAPAGASLPAMSSAAESSAPGRVPRRFRASSPAPALSALGLPAASAHV